MSHEILKILKELESDKIWGTKLFRYGFVIIFTLFLTGSYLFFIDRMSNSDMFLLLWHFAAGFLFVIPCVMFFLRHKKYHLIFKLRSFTLYGYVVFALMLTMLLSGLILFFKGVSAYLSLYYLHTITSIIVCLGLFFYIRQVIRYFSAPLDLRGKWFITKTVLIVSFQVIFLSLFLVVIVFIGGKFYQEESPDKVVDNYSYDLVEKAPFLPSALKTKSGSFYKEKFFLNSKSCGVSGCHSDTLKQFEDSVHYRTPNTVLNAVENLLVKETAEGKLYNSKAKASILELRRQINGKESFRFCAACHSPVALLSGNITPGAPEPTFEKFEGDSCIFCHSIEKTSFGSGENTVAPPKRYLFAHSENKVAQFLYRTMVNSKPELHKMTFMRPFYKKSTYCIGCHTRLQFPHWQTSPYNKDNSFALKDTKECQSCHMKQVASNHDVSAYKKGTIADHRTLAANYIIPMLYHLPEQKKLTEEFLKDKKIKIGIIAPAVIGHNRLTMAVRMGNVGVGHIFPSGPEGDLIESWPEITIKDQTGKILYRYGQRDKDGYLDQKKTRIYRVRPFDVNGKALELDRHRSWKFVMEEATVILPREFDEIIIEQKLPALPDKTRLSVVARMNYRKPNQAFADFLLGKGKFIVPVIDMDQDIKEILVSQNKKDYEPALKKWKESLSQDFFGLKKQTGKITVPDRMPMEDMVIVRQALELFKAKEYIPFLKRLNDISPVAKLKVAQKDYPPYVEIKLYEALRETANALKTQQKHLDDYFNDHYR